jgi:hypothetical protein
LIFRWWLFSTSPPFDGTYATVRRARSRRTNQRRPRPSVMDSLRFLT